MEHGPTFSIARHRRWADNCGEYRHPRSKYIAGTTPVGENHAEPFGEFASMKGATHMIDDHYA
jgi:hypothetical protein